MKITLSPIASDHTTVVAVSGLVVTVDGEPYDLSVIPEGGQAEAGPEAEGPFVGTATRNAATIRYHYDSLKAEPDQPTDLSDYAFDIEEGAVPSPIRWKS